METRNKEVEVEKTRKFNSEEFLKDLPITIKEDKETDITGSSSSNKYSSSKASVDLSDIEIGVLGIGFKSWNNVANISGRIVRFQEELAIVDCLMDESPRRYETRGIKKSLLVDIPLVEGQLIQIRVFERANESKFSIHNGDGIVPSSDFKIDGLFEGLDDDGIFSLK